MPRTTPNLNLFVPDPGQSGIAAELNSNYDAIDGTMDPIGGHKHTGAPGAAPKIAVANIAATGTPDATTYLRGDGQWAVGSGGSTGVTDHGALTGLADDDHPQYHTQARGDGRWLQRASNLADIANAAAARAALDAAQTAHVHAAADVSSGVMAPARLGAGAASGTTFLRGDGQWAAVAGTGVGGSGTAGRAAFWSAVSTLSGIANSIYWDSVNGRLGIGTETPGAPVTISANALSTVSSGVAVSTSTTITTPLTGTSNAWSQTATYDPASAHSGNRIWAALRATAAVDSTVPGLTLQLLLRGHQANAQNLGSAVLSGLSTAMYAQVSNLAAGSMANASAVSGLVSNSGTGVMTVAAALRALRPANSGTIGDVYGLYVENQTPSSGTVTGGKYGIYQEGTADINVLLGKLSIGQAAPTALVHIKAGTAAPNTAPLKLTAGTLLTAIEDGTIEYSSAGFFASHAGVRTALGGAGSGMTNPMTTAGDLIVGGASGAPARLPKGTALQQLRMNSGATAEEWFTPAAASNPDSTLDLHEEFIGGNLSAFDVGMLSWGTGGTIAGQSSEANHPGIVRMSTVVTTGNTARVELRNVGAIDALLPSETFTMAYITRIVTNDANTTCRVGAAGSWTSPPVNGIYFEKLDADTTWFAVCRSASVQTRTDTTVATGTGWVAMLIRRIDASTLGFKLGATLALASAATEQTIATNVPTVGLMPGVQVANSAAAIKAIEADYFRLLIPLTR